MKLCLIMFLTASLLVGCATVPQQPVLLEHYQTLGHEVYKYGYHDWWSGNYVNQWYEIYDEQRLVARANFLGFLQWKKEELLKLIESPNTDQGMRESYKIQYEEADDTIRKIEYLFILNELTKPKVKPVYIGQGLKAPTFN